MLARFTLIDYDREMALVAVFKERSAAADGEIVETERIVGVSRYVTNLDQSSCEFSLVVADDFSGKGLGSRLMESIMDVAREKGLSRDRRPGAGQESRHAEAHEEPGLFGQAVCRRPRLHAGDARAVMGRDVQPPTWTSCTSGRFAA